MTDNITPNKLSEIVLHYQDLLQQIDQWFSDSVDRYPEHISCTGGCSGCCRGLFDVTLLDGVLLRQGLDLLSPPLRDEIRHKARQRLELLQRLWPELAPPFSLNHRTEDEWEDLMPDEDETPCLLLDDKGRCLVYEHRPMTCRLHGLPLVDVSGAVMHDEWCTENFTTVNPLALPGLTASFDEIFRREVFLGRELTSELLGEVVFELDTLIPLAILMDYAGFDWQSWWRASRAGLLPPTATN